MRIDATDSWESLRARISSTPADAKIRGMFLRDLIRAVPTVKIKAPYYIPFSLYPIRDYMDLILQIARARYPNETPANGVLRVGSSVYTTFMASLSGKAIFALADVDFRRAVELSPKAYEVTIKPGKVEVHSLTPKEAFIGMRSVWPFPDIFHVGVWLGGMQSFGVSGTIEATRRTLSDVDFRVRWWPKDAKPPV